LNHLNAIRGISSLSEKKLPKGYNIRMLKLERYGKALLDTLRDKGFNIQFHVRDYTFDDYNRMILDIANSNEPYLKLYVVFSYPHYCG